MLTSTKQIFGTGSDELNYLILQQEELENQKFLERNSYIRMYGHPGIAPPQRTRIFNDNFAPNPIPEPKDPVTKFILLLIAMLVIILFIGQILFN